MTKYILASLLFVSSANAQLNNIFGGCNGGGSCGLTQTVSVASGNSVTANGTVFIDAVNSTATNTYVLGQVPGANLCPYGIATASVTGPGSLQIVIAGITNVLQDGEVDIGDLLSSSLSIQGMIDVGEDILENIDDNVCVSAIALATSVGPTGVVPILFNNPVGSMGTFLTATNLANVIGDGVTASLGGGSFTAGQCVSGTASLPGATTSNVISVTPVTYPGDGIYWEGYVSSLNTITVKVCSAIIKASSAGSVYNVRVLP
jgi:hypothetical protein